MGPMQAQQASASWRSMAVQDSAKACLRYLTACDEAFVFRAPVPPSTPVVPRIVPSRQIDEAQSVADLLPQKYAFLCRSDKLVCFCGREDSAVNFRTWRLLGDHDQVLICTECFERM